MKNFSIVTLTLIFLGQTFSIAGQFDQVIEDLKALPTPTVDQAIKREGSEDISGTVLFASIANDAKISNNPSSKTKLTDIFIGGLLHEDRGAWQAVLKRANNLDELPFSSEALAVVENFEPESGFHGRYYVMLGAIGNPDWIPTLERAASDTSLDSENIWYGTASWSAKLALAKMGDEDRSIEISETIRKSLATEFVPAYQRKLGSHLIYVGDNHSIGVLVDYLFDDRNFPKRIDVEEGKYYYEPQENWYALWAAHYLAKHYDDMPKAGGSNLEFVLEAREWIESNILSPVEALPASIDDAQKQPPAVEVVKSLDVTATILPEPDHIAKPEPETASWWPWVVGGGVLLLIVAGLMVKRK